MKILGFQSGHDVSYCVLENGVPIIHDELERFLRLKEPMGDGLKMAFDHLPTDVIKDIGHFTLGNFGMLSEQGIRSWGAPKSGVDWNMGCYDQKSVDKMNYLISRNNGGFYEVGHHLSHAANAFYTSNFEDALIVTIDGGGWESATQPTAFTISIGKDKDITPIEIFPIEQINFGYIWNHMTAYAFGLSAGYPKGNQCGSVMAMATVGDPKYKDYFEASGKKINYDELKRIVELSEQESFNVAASLQKFTEEAIMAILKPYIEKYQAKNLCFSGGVSLNCVMLGKIKESFDIVEEVFADPVPYDAGLSLGSARYLWHSILGNDRIYDEPQNQTSYLGKTYSFNESLKKLINDDFDLEFTTCNDSDIIEHLASGKIISVFGGASESGRRALGNRSILADPRNPDMKDIINQKVKHRQWYRPFAPSILREDVSEWFTDDISSPYMSFAIKFKEEQTHRVPAVVHYDNTGRLQTVKESQNAWYYNLLKLWKEKTGVPILLNTSFNDREPIVETPQHAINCFKRTNIDYLYFYNFGILLNKKENV